QSKPVLQRLIRHAKEWLKRALDATKEELPAATREMLASNGAVDFGDLWPKVGGSCVTRKPSSIAKRKTGLVLKRKSSAMKSCIRSKPSNPAKKSVAFNIVGYSLSECADDGSSAKADCSSDKEQALERRIADLEREKSALREEHDRTARALNEAKAGLDLVKRKLNVATAGL
ncbi:hypothetical protein AAVH_30080, partial [Aphelenchoides avenae]